MCYCCCSSSSLISFRMVAAARNHHNHSFYAVVCRMVIYCVLVALCSVGYVRFNLNVCKLKMWTHVFKRDRHTHTIAVSGHFWESSLIGRRLFAFEWKQATTTESNVFWIQIRYNAFGEWMIDFSLSLSLSCSVCAPVFVIIQICIFTASRIMMDFFYVRCYSSSFSTICIEIH